MQLTKLFVKNESRSACMQSNESIASGNISLCLKRHAGGIASRHVLRLFYYSS